MRQVAGKEAGGHAEEHACDTESVDVSRSVAMGARHAGEKDPDENIEKLVSDAYQQNRYSRIDFEEHGKDHASEHHDGNGDAIDARDVESFIHDHSGGDQCEADYDQGEQ